MTLRDLVGAAAAVLLSVSLATPASAYPTPTAAGAPRAAAITVPSAPTNVTGLAGPASLTVAWQPPTSDGGATIIAYRVRIAPTGRTVRVAAPASSAIVTGLADGEAVTASVQAENRIGRGVAATATGGAVTPTPLIRTVAEAPSPGNYVDLAAAPDGTTYVATRSSILQISPDGDSMAPLDVGTVAPRSVAVGPGGDLYWTDESEGGWVVRRLHDGVVDTIAGDPEAFAYPSSEPVPALEASLISPLDLAVSPVDGSVYLVDYLCSVVERFTIGGDLEVVAGVAGSCPIDGSFSGDGGPATEAHLNQPQSVAVDPSGAVYVGDTRNNRVRRFTVGGTIDTVAGDGTEVIDLTHDGLATETGVPDPSRIAWAPGRGLLIDSLGRQRLLADEHLTRLGDDAYDWAVTESRQTVPGGAIAANDSTLALDWTGPVLKVVVIAPGTGSGDSWLSKVKWIGPWSAAAEPVDHPGFGSWADLVTLHHRAFVDRPATATELSSWTTALEGGTKTPGELDDALRRSADNLNYVDPVVRLYRAFLGRAPDASGLQFWIGRRRSSVGTWTLNRMAAQFANSNEFRRKYDNLSNRAFVSHIYADVLGRPQDPGGIDFWTRRLDTGRSTRAQVVVGFSESGEYRRKQADNTNVTVAYVALLGRVPTEGETNDWVTRRRAGTPHVDLLDELVRTAALPRPG